MARPVQPEKITFPPFNIIKGESGLRRIPPKPKREHTATGADHPNQARIPRGSPADPPRIPLGSLHFSGRNYELQSILRALRAPPRGAVGMQISSGSPVHAQWCFRGVLATAGPTSGSRAPSTSPFPTHTCGTRGGSSALWIHFFSTPTAFVFLHNGAPRRPSEFQVSV